MALTYQNGKNVTLSRRDGANLIRLYPETTGMQVALTRRNGVTQADVQKELEILHGKTRAYDARTGNLHLYVRADGNDENDGLADSPERALRTVTRAAELINAQVECGNHGIYVHIGEGEFYGAVILHVPPGNTYVEFRGAGKEKTKIKRENGLCMYLSSGGVAVKIASLAVEHVRKQGIGTYICHMVGGDVRFEDVMFSEDDQSNQVAGDTGDELVVCSGPAIVSLARCDFRGVIAGKPRVSAGCIYALNGGHILCSGTLTFNGDFNYMANAITGGFINVSNAVASGSAKGKRYNVSSGGVIYTNGKGAEFFPGTIQGTVQSESGALYW